MGSPWGCRRVQRYRSGRDRYGVEVVGVDRTQLEGRDALALGEDVVGRPGPHGRPQRPDLLLGLLQQVVALGLVGLAAGLVEQRRDVGEDEAVVRVAGLLLLRRAAVLALEVRQRKTRLVAVAV